MADIYTECSTDIGITISLIDGIIATSRILASCKTQLDTDEKTTMLVLLTMLHSRDKSDNEVKEAMIDLEQTTEFKKIKKLLNLK